MLRQKKEVKEILEKAGVELTDEEVEGVAGGVRMNWPSSRD